MSLLSTIRSDQILARKVGNRVESSILTTLLGEAVAVGKNDGNRETTDVEVIKTVQKFVKNINETIGSLKSDDPRVTVLMIERDVLEKYLPKQLSANELRQTVQTLVDGLTEKSPKQKGVIMKALRDQYDGQYDGKLASDIVSELLK